MKFEAFSIVPQLHNGYLVISPYSMSCNVYVNVCGGFVLSDYLCNSI